MTFRYRSATVPFGFDHEDLRFSARVTACRSMMTVRITAPFAAETDLVQIPMIALQGTKTGLVNEQCTALSEFGERVARGAILRAYRRRIDLSPKII